MIKNKNTQSVRWLGVFSTVKKLVEKRLLSPYKDVNFLGELEIKSQKKIQVRCCNKDNKASKTRGYLCFFDKIAPSKFDYLVCVYMDKYKDIQGHYIFTRDEVISFFPEMVDIDGKTLQGFKGLYIPRDEKMEEPMYSLIDLSFENWEKIKL
jgi:hypothetical protein